MGKWILRPASEVIYMYENVSRNPIVVDDLFEMGVVKKRIFCISENLNSNEAS